MEDRKEQIAKLSKVRGKLVGERQAVVNSLEEASDFPAAISKLVRHQEAIEAIDRIIADEEKLGKPPYGMDNV